MKAAREEALVGNRVMVERNVCNESIESDAFGASKQGEDLASRDAARSKVAGEIFSEEGETALLSVEGAHQVEMMVDGAG